MAELNKVIRYFAFHYPYKNELSKTRMTKMVYLADWFSAQKYGSQLTEIKWFFDDYGPYVRDVYEVAKKDNKLTIKEEMSTYNFPKQVIALKKDTESALDLGELSSRDRAILEEVIEETKSLNFSEFVEFVYDTYPIKNEKKYTFLDLVRFAEQQARK